MPDDLATLEAQRSKLLEEFLRLSDLRPGSITAVTRRCGKPSCHCAKHNDPGHDPQFRLTRRVSGRTVTETFPNPTALRKAQQEVAEFHRFQKLSQDLVALNVTSVSVRWMSNWTSKIQSFLPGCAACMLGWAKRLPSITVASRCNSWPVWR